MLTLFSSVCTAGYLSWIKVRNAAITSCFFRALTSEYRYEFLVLLFNPSDVNFEKCFLCYFNEMLSLTPLTVNAVFVIQVEQSSFPF